MKKNDKKKYWITWWAIMILLGIPFGMLTKNIFLGFGIALCFAGSFKY